MDFDPTLRRWNQWGGRKKKRKKKKETIDRRASQSIGRSWKRKVTECEKEWYEVNDLFAFLRSFYRGVSRAFVTCFGGISPHSARTGRVYGPSRHCSWCCIRTENAFRNTRHCMMPSIVSPVKQNVPVRWRPLRPITEQRLAWTKAFCDRVAAVKAGWCDPELINRSSESISPLRDPVYRVPLFKTQYSSVTELFQPQTSGLRLEDAISNDCSSLNM